MDAISEHKPGNSRQYTVQPQEGQAATQSRRVLDPSANNVETPSRGLEILFHKPTSDLQQATRIKSTPRQPAAGSLG